MNQFEGLRTGLVRLEDKIDAVPKYAETRLGGLADDVERLGRRLDASQAHVLARLAEPEPPSGLDLEAEAKESGVDLPGA